MFDNLDITVDNLSISDSNKNVILRTDVFTIPSYGWYFESINLDSVGQDDTITLECKITNGSIEIDYTQKIQLKYLNNIHDNLIRIEFN